MIDLIKRVSGKISKLSPEQVEQLFDVLIEAKDNADAILDSLTTGLVICDKKYHVIMVNKSAERYIPLKMRASESRIGEEPIWNFVADKDIADFLEKSYKEDASNVSKEFTLETRGGTIKFFTISLMPLVHRKKLEGTIIAVDDITEKRQQEIRLRRMEKLADLTNLAANVAHEIKNPLGSMSLHIQLLERAIKKAREGDNTLPEEKFLEKYINVVNEEIERLNGIVVDFLFAVRPINAEFQLMDPNELLTRYMDFCKPELEEKGIELQMNLEENPPKLLLDGKLFRQVILNLVQNAEGAMTEGGQLRISSQIKNDKFIVSIADTGIGMDEKTAARIFEPYFTTKTTGTGLGLTMVYKIIKEFSGDIQVQSILGEGSVFIITLPIPQREHKLLEYKK